MTFDDLNDLPSTLGAPQVADIWGCSEWAVYAMVKANSCPVAPLRLGRKLRWPTLPVLRSVGLDLSDQR
jgi:predicted DNA-binding transcriptional regulator AlpA